MYPSPTVPVANTTTTTTKRARVEEETSRQAVLTATLHDIQVRAIGFGTLPCTVTYPSPELTPDEDKFLALLRQVCGIGTLSAAMLVDTADVYSPNPRTTPNYAERLLSQVLKEIDGNGHVVVSTKGGMQRISADSTGWRPLPLQCEVLIPRMQTSLIALDHNNTRPVHVMWSLHHCDPAQPKEEFVKLVDDLAKALKTHDGMNTSTKVMFGLANATPMHIRLAAAAGIRAVQNEYSWWVRDAELDKTSSSSSSRRGVMKAVSNVSGLVFVAHSPFGGLKTRRGERDLLAVFPQLAHVAAHRTQQCSAYQIYLLYLLHRGERVMGIRGRMIVIVGGRDVKHVMEDLTAVELNPLSEVEIRALDEGWDSKR